MKKNFTILTICALFTLVGCQDTEIERTGTLLEKAVVVTLIHSPSEHKTEVTRVAYKNGDGMTSTDFNGNTGYKISKNKQVTTTVIPAKYGVAFQCDHGTFTVEGDKTKHKVLYDKLYQSVGDTVTILYQEEYLLTFEKINDKRVLVKRQLRRLDFLDAQK
jgi:hypothetical protein